MQGQTSWIFKIKQEIVFRIGEPIWRRYDDLFLNFFSIACYPFACKEINQKRMIA